MKNLLERKTNVLMARLQGARSRTSGVGVATAMLSLVMLAGLSACESEPGLPVVSETLPQAQVQAAEISPQELKTY